MVNLHELFVAENLLKLALEHAEKASAVRINAIDLLIGDLASIIDDSVAFHWDIISRDTIAEGAELRFNRVPAKVYCYDCAEENTLLNGQLCCPKCNGINITPTAGTEFLLQSIEVETAD
ncbi:MAG: hydrogenase maturation nickel metallochaperone HypA [Anaerolineales bacterium]